MDAKERIEKLLEMNGLNAKTLSERIGLDRPQALYDILNGKTKSITEKMAVKIISAFPNIQKVWLITGEGDILYKAKLASEMSLTAETNDTERRDKTVGELLDVIIDQQKTIKMLRERVEYLEGKGDTSESKTA